MKEIRRQIAHMSGFSLVPAAMLFSPSFAGLVSLVSGLIIFLYSLHIKGKKRAGHLGKEGRIRKLFFFFERDRPKWPFMGAFTLFFSSAAAFFLLPAAHAFAAVTVVTIADGLSTLVGHHIGKVKILGPKTLEGTLVFFLSSLLAMAFVPPEQTILLALFATSAELSTAAGHVRNSRLSGFIDDNWVVMLAAGVALQIPFS